MQKMIFYKLGSVKSNKVVKFGLAILIFIISITHHMLVKKRKVFPRNLITRASFILVFFYAVNFIEGTLDVCRHFDGNKHIHTPGKECDGLHASDAKHHHNDSAHRHGDREESHHAPCSHEIVKQENLLLQVNNKFKLNLSLIPSNSGVINFELLQTIDDYKSAFILGNTRDPPFSPSPVYQFIKSVRLVV